MEQLDVEKLIGELEVAVDRLRSLYEQYFMGFEKLEPTVPRKDVDRRIHVLRKEQIRNTALRFRFHMLLQRYNTYQTHWQRICREIENGTYKRHILRAQQRFAERRRSSAPPPSNDALQLAVLPVPPLPPLSDAKAKELAELDAEFAPRAAVTASPIFVLDSEPPAAARPPPVPQAARPLAPRPVPAAPVPKGGDALKHVAIPPTPPAAAQPRVAAPAGQPAAALAEPRPPRPWASVVPRPQPPPPPAQPRPAVSAPQQPSPGSDSGLTDARVRQLYAQYVDAKRRHNESTATITYEAVAKTLRESQAKLREKHGKTVDFEVSIRDGKAILKPVLK